MSRFFIILTFLIILAELAEAQNDQPVRIGIITDNQYCDCPDNGNRHYRLSLGKLDTCIETLNSQPLDAVFNLGDLIDHDWGSYDSVMPRYAKLHAPMYIVLGNHDYMIGKKHKDELLERLGMKKAYYKLEIGTWTFIILNGDDLSYVAPQTREQKEERNDMVASLYASLHLNGMIWNGGIGHEQMKWLRHRLEEAQADGRNVIVMCHFPLFSKENHNLFNNKEVYSLLQGYSCVKAYFDGHYHAGGYQDMQGLHLVNFKGMVDTRLNAFSVVTLSSRGISIKGYGREPDRELIIRK
jgi:manganese-dependent ADP-ribose/CDP-alcohol diphosphatase